MVGREHQWRESAIRTLTRLYSCDADARVAVSNLELAGIPRSNIIVIHDCKQLIVQTGQSSTRHIDYAGLWWPAAGVVTGIASAFAILFSAGPGLFMGAAFLFALPTFGLSVGAAVGAVTSASRISGADRHVCFEGTCSGTTLVSARLPSDALERCNEAMERRKSLRPSNLEGTVRANAPSANDVSLGQGNAPSQQISEPVPLFQLIAGGDPPGRDDVRALSTVAAER